MAKKNIDIISRQRKIEKITKDYNYIKWLYNFMKIHKSFELSEILSDKKVAQSDKEKVLLLSALFAALDNYYTKYKIKSCVTDEKVEYTFFYQDILYRVSIITGNKTTFGISSENNSKKVKSVSYDKIMKYSSPKAYENIKLAKDTLLSDVNVLKDLGLSKIEIEQLVKTNN